MKRSFLALVTITFLVPNLVYAEVGEISNVRGGEDIEAYSGVVNASSVESNAGISALISRPNNNPSFADPKLHGEMLAATSAGPTNNPSFISPRISGQMAASTSASFSDNPLYVNRHMFTNMLFARISKSGLYSGIFSFKGTRAHSNSKSLRVTCTYTGPLTFSSGYFVNEAGKRVTVTIPSGSILKGKSKGRSFVAKMKQGDDTHTLKVSNITSTSAKVSLKIDSHFYPGASCSYSFAGSFIRQ